MSGKPKLIIKGEFILLSLLCLVLGRLGIFLSYVISVLLHEFSHYFVAKIYYYDCNSISLSAFGAVLYGDFEEKINKQQVVIALAGPLANLLLICISLTIWYIFPETYSFTLNFVWANVVILIVNLLPCYPLDGGKVLCGLLGRKLPYDRALKLTRTISLLFSLTFFLVFLVALIFRYNLFSLGLFAVFLLSSSFSSPSGNIYSKISATVNPAKLIKKGVEHKTYSFFATATLRQVIRRIDNSALCKIEVSSPDLTLIGYINQKQLSQYTLQHSLDDTLADILQQKGQS